MFERIKASGRRALTMLALVVTATAGLAVIGGSTASAEDVGASAWELDYAKNTTMSGKDKECSTDSPWVSVCFQPSGDIFWVRDKEADGNRVAIEWRDLSGNRVGRCTDTLGVAADWTSCNKDLPEGHNIQWRAGHWDFGQWNLDREFTTYA